jgi:crossover junction endonuclease MUS81
MQACSAIIWPSNNFEICCLVDSREKEFGALVVSAMTDKGIPVETRPLAIGDFVWIARRRARSPCSHNGGNGCYEEVVLDFIVERKRRSDLVTR